MIRIVIVEDDKLTARTIRHLCDAAFESETTNIRLFDRMVPALYYIQENPIDLLILDINLQGESGFELLKRPEKSAFHTIIVSSESGNAVNAFNFGVLDFIVKPITRERFMAAIARLRSSTTAQGQYKNSLPVKKDGMIELVRYRDILYLNAVGNFTDIYLQNGQIERVRRTMDAILTELNSDFFRSHRSYIINLAEVRRILRGKNNTYAVIVGDGAGEGTEIPLSRSRYNVLKTILSDDEPDGDESPQAAPGADS